MNSAKHLLQQHYQIFNEKLPTKRLKSEWEAENNYGFLLGILCFGLETHQNQLHSLLLSNKFQEQEQAFIDSMFDFYIRTFHRRYNAYVNHEGREHSYEDFEEALIKRDKACLFCWCKLCSEATYIILNLTFGIDEKSMLHRAGMSDYNQVQNGLLLCATCHHIFSCLGCYVDFVDGKFVVKAIGDDPKECQYVQTRFKILRFEDRWIKIDQRKAEESNGETALYFVQKDENLLPNRAALEFHKTACFIWRMAGGENPEHEYYWSENDPIPIDTAALKRRFNIAEDVQL